MTNQIASGTGCLLIHGYGGNTFEMEGLANALIEAGIGARLVSLPGHGENFENFRQYRFSHWLAQAEEDLRDMAAHCERVIVVGFSMGGTIALQLAARYPVAGIVTLAAPVYALGFWPWPLANLVFYGQTIVSQIRYFLGLSKPHINAETSRDIAPWKGYWGPLHFGQLYSIREGCAVTRVLLPRLTAPVLIIHDARDALVDSNNAWAIAAQISSSDTTVILTRIRENVTRHHVITTHRETRVMVNEAVVRFCREKALDPKPCP